MKIPEVIKFESDHVAGSLAKILTVIGEEGLLVEGLHHLIRGYKTSTWEITLETEDQDALNRALKKVDALSNARIIGRSDRVFNEHKGGKIKTVSRKRIDSLELLRDIYTPGVARVCLDLLKNPEHLREYTNIANTVAVITNGTAILGLGNIGPVAGLPVMEGKAALMAELADLTGVPILINESDPQKIIDIIKGIAPSFGAIQLEDIKAPECFEIESQLQKLLNIPVMHDDQHGTAVVVLAALLNAAKLAKVDLKNSTVGQIGLGAAGLGICRLLIKYGVKKVIGTDLNKDSLKRLKSFGGNPVDLKKLMEKADIVVATTGVKGLIKPEMVRKDQVILALSNPEPEIEPEAALNAGAKFATDGKVVNNVLGFPGIFRGTLDSGVSKITDTMLIAAAIAIAKQAVQPALVPDPLDRQIHVKVANAVLKAALKKKKK